MCDGLRTCPTVHRLVIMLPAVKYLAGFIWVWPVPQISSYHWRYSRFRALGQRALTHQWVRVHPGTIFPAPKQARACRKIRNLGTHVVLASMSCHVNKRIMAQSHASVLPIGSVILRLRNPSGPRDCQQAPTILITQHRAAPGTKPANKRQCTHTRRGEADCRLPVKQTGRKTTRGGRFWNRRTPAPRSTPRGCVESEL